jgi:hypothetical protein
MTMQVGPQAARLTAAIEASVKFVTYGLTGASPKGGFLRRSWMVGGPFLAFIAFSFNPTLVTAQAATPTTSGYVSGAPNNPLWLALATPDGRWAIQLSDDCSAITPDMNVRVVGRADDPDARLLSAEGHSCALTASVRMSTVPCAENDAGQCDFRNV